MSLDVCLEMDIDTGGEETESIELYSANITHNLGKMAKEAGIYKYLWQPQEINIKTAGQLIEPLNRGLELMLADPERFKKFDAPNGWGLYKHFVPWINKYIKACEEHPKAIVRVWV